MTSRRTGAFALCLFATLLWIIPKAALADRIGTPYRGPLELLGAGGGGTTTDDGGGGGTPDSGGGDSGGGDSGGGDSGGGDSGGGDSGGGDTPGAGASTGGAGGKKAKLDGQILWQWYWEHNKDRFLASATTPGRVRMGSAEYWFGAGAKYPPRALDSISDALRKASVYATLHDILGKENNNGVLAEACIALGRVGYIGASDKERKEGQSDNLVVRDLIGILAKSKDKDVRLSAILALGMTGHPDAGEYLMRNQQQFVAEERPWVYIAYGLARYAPAIPRLVDALPKSAKAKSADEHVAAITGLGLMGRDLLPEIEKYKGVEKLRKLVDGRGYDPTVMQTATALGRLEVERDKVSRLVSGKCSKDINWQGLLALSYYASDEKEAGAAAKTLEGRAGFKSGDGQNKSFAILALGDLANRLPSTSKVRAAILKFIKDKALDTRNNYLRSSACLALGMAGDTTAIPEIASLVMDKTGADYVAAAAAVGLGLLRATDHAKEVREGLMLKRNWNDDARGYGALGLALMGDTTRVGQLLEFSKGTLSARAERQLPVALSVLGDKRHVRTQLDWFADPWKNQDRYKVSNAAYGLTWMRDQSAIAKLVQRATTHADPNVRGIAVVALGYCAARDRVDPLSRIYENMSHRNRFGNWDVMYYIAHIL